MSDSSAVNEVLNLSQGTTQRAVGRGRDSGESDGERGRVELIFIVDTCATSQHGSLSICDSIEFLMAEVDVMPQALVLDLICRFLDERSSDRTFLQLDPRDPEVRSDRCAGRVVYPDHHTQVVDVGCADGDVFDCVELELSSQRGQNRRCVLERAGLTHHV